MASHCIHAPPFVYPFVPTLMDTWAVFPLWLLYTRVQVFTWTYVFISLGCIPGSGIAGPHGNCLTFEDLPDCCPRLLRRLHSRQQHVRAPACPHRHLYVWSACVAAAGLVAGKWCLLLGLTCCGPRRALLAGLPGALGGTGPGGRRVFCPRRCSCLSPRGGYKPGACPSSPDRCGRRLPSAQVPPSPVSPGASCAALGQCLCFFFARSREPLGERPAHPFQPRPAALRARFKH